LKTKRKKKRKRLQLLPLPLLLPLQDLLPLLLVLLPRLLLLPLIPLPLLLQQRGPLRPPLPKRKKTKRSCSAGGIARPWSKRTPVPIFAPSTVRFTPVSLPFVTTVRVDVFPKRECLASSKWKPL
jgi:hypothetical protein